MGKPAWHISGSYLLLSALAYLALGIQLEANDGEGLLALALVAVVNVLAQGLFAVLIGPSRYLVPIPIWRLVLGSLYAGALLAVQGFAVLVTLDDVGMVSLPHAEFAWWALLLGPGIGAVAALCVWSRGADRLAVLERMGLAVGAGALANLGVVVPLYLCLVRGHDGGFLYGLGSMLAIMAGLLTLAWSLGPVFLFLHVRRRRRALRAQCLACGYDLHGLSQMRCPECGRAFTFEDVHATAEELRVAGDGDKG